MVCGLNIHPVGGHYPMVDLGGEIVGGGRYPGTARSKEKKDNPPPDFDSMHGANVSEKAKQTIEHLEPGVHGFHPVEYLDHQGDHLENRYWFEPGHLLDSVNRELTTFVLTPVGTWRSAKDLLRRGKPVPSHIDPEAKPRMVFDLTVIGAAHIWRDKHLSGTWLSDDAVRLFQGEGLTGLRVTIGAEEAV